MAGGAWALLAAVLGKRFGVPLLIGTLLPNYPARYWPPTWRAYPLRDLSGLLVVAIWVLLQGREIPSQFTAVLPYVVTLAGLTILESRRCRRQRRHRQRIAVPG